MNYNHILPYNLFIYSKLNPLVSLTENLKNIKHANVKLTKTIKTPFVFNDSSIYGKI